MIVDIYQYFKDHPSFNKLVGDDYLFVEYKCPLQVNEFQFWTDCHMIMYVVSGRKDWITPDNIIEMKAGDALFIRKGVYGTRQYLEEDYCVLCFFINDQFIRRFLDNNPRFTTKNTPTQPVYRIHINESFESLISSIFYYFKQGSEIPRQLVEIKFQELLFNIALNQKNEPIVHCLNGVELSGYSAMEDVMLRHFKYDLPLEAFARLCGKSLSGFKRSFARHFETSPAQWLSQKRLEYARTLLMSSTLSIHEVCFECGFKNPSHFSRAFKNRYQLSPLQFKAAAPVV